MSLPGLLALRPLLHQLAVPTAALSSSSDAVDAETALQRAVQCAGGASQRHWQCAVPGCGHTSTGDMAALLHTASAHEAIALAADAAAERQAAVNRAAAAAHASCTGGGTALAGSGSNADAGASAGAGGRGGRGEGSDWLAAAAATASDSALELAQSLQHSRCTDSPSRPNCSFGVGPGVAGTTSRSVQTQAPSGSFPCNFQTATVMTAAAAPTLEPPQASAAVRGSDAEAFALRKLLEDETASPIAAGAAVDPPAFGRSGGLLSRF